MAIVRVRSTAPGFRVFRRAKVSLDIQGLATGLLAIPPGLPSSTGVFGHVILGSVVSFAVHLEKLTDRNLVVRLDRKREFLGLHLQVERGANRLKT